MTVVKVAHRPVNEILDIVKELRLQGLVQGEHFDFAFHQTAYDPITGHMIEDRHTLFTFHAEKYATLFALKYV
jgi:hypothetical protein